MFRTIISPQELHEKLGRQTWVIIDCRYSLGHPDAGEEAYKKSHIPGASYAHLDRDLSGKVVPGKTGRHPLPSIVKMTQRFSSWGISDGIQVVLYDDRSGAIAARLWWMLRYLGHDRVAVLDGGWRAWEAEGYPVETAIMGAGPRVFKPRERESWVVDADHVQRRLGAENFLLVDSRMPERYRGEDEPIDPVAGHIPGATNFPHTDLVDSEGMWLTPDELEERFQTLVGNDVADEMVFYCGSGVTACRNLLAHHHAGFGDAKLYPGSWSDWITDPERPIERSV
ncbi:MAG: sulfurtransferase [Phaeodactylibacter xiamenensis]|nr:sulfurtransferase [Phaeodactylibacter xiamenensis]MCR9052359.1 sulfurtransferase [bacterium]